MIFYISDTHFYHKNILRYCNRPYFDVDSMNESMIKKWNVKVSNDDIVYHLGDFGFASYSKLKNIFDSLNGNKILIPGNHDDKRVLKLPWDEITPLIHNIKDNDISVCLCHYPILEWPGKYDKTLHLHGHTHNATIPLDPSYMRANVSVDATAFEPVTLEELFQDKDIEINNYFLNE